ncbi:unnamed protein product [Rhizophagus irregularis]|nr:unnamed protein product [Rhizophagus irregularis]
MQFSLNCLISGQSSDDVFNVPLGEHFIGDENTKVKLNNMTVANFKQILLRRTEIKEAGVTRMSIWKVELDSNEVKTLSTENIKSHKERKGVFISL